MPPDFNFDSSSEKIMTDGFSMRIINGLMHLAIKSGTSIRCYVLPLHAAKAAGRGLIKQVEEIEQKTGQKFDMPLSDEPVPTPLTDFRDQGKDKK